MSLIFNPNEIKRTSHELIPPGLYRLVASEFKRDFKDTGDFLISITCDVICEEEEGRKVFLRYNVIHSNEKAQEISQEQLAYLCDVLGLSSEFQNGFELDEVEDGILNDMFLNKPFDAKIGIKKDKKGVREDENVINKYFEDGKGGPKYGGVSVAPARPAANTNASTARSTGNGGSAPSSRPAASAPPQESAPQESAPPKAAAAGSRPWDRK